MSRRITEDEVRRRLEERNDVELVMYAGTIRSLSRFRCPKGHEWSTSANNVVRGTGCAVCAGRTPIDEAEVRHRLADRTDVELLNYGGTTHAPSRFRCSQGHEWVTSAKSVVGGSGCRVCNHKGQPSIPEAEVRRRLEHRDDVEIVEYAGSTNSRSRFRCPEGHEWSAPCTRVLGGSGCAVCAKNVLLDEGEIRRRLSAPTDVELIDYAGTTNAKSTFRCPRGHEWTVATTMVLGGTGCRVCSGFATVTEPEVRRRLAERQLEIVDYAGNTKGISTFRCSEGHEWKTSAGNVFAGKGCRICAGAGLVDEVEARRRLAGRHDVELVRYSGNVAERSSFCCPKGHEWAAPASRVIGGAGCPICAGVLPVDEEEVRRRLAGRVDVELIRYAGSLTGRSNFRCPLGHEWETTVGSVLRPTGCAVCAGKAHVDESELRRRLSGRDDVELVHYGGTLLGRSKFRCPLGHEWSTSANSVIGGSGCGVCNPGGFRSDLPSWLYLLRHDPYLAFKIGITNNPAKRIDRDHDGRGWQSVRLWKVDGALAREVELAIVRSWRMAGLHPSIPQTFDGWTETVSMMSVEVDDVILEVERLIREADQMRPGSDANAGS